LRTRPRDIEQAAFSIVTASGNARQNRRWNEHVERRRNLRYVVNNTRFLPLPWVEGTNAASRVLSPASKRLPAERQARCGYRPRPIETVVPVDRFTGNCYRAANRIHAGHTKGRGRMDRHFKAEVGRKAMFVYPLVQDAARQLRTR
jgi:hypothetical protein